MEEQNFQHFLKALNGIELKNVEAAPEGDRRERKPSECCKEDQKLSFVSSFPGGFLPDIHSLAPTGKVAMGSCNGKRTILRQPGFVYRTKNPLTSTYLDNNLWELTRSKRVLKSPSFKYRQSRKSALSPYSACVLDGLTGLSLNTSQPCQNNSAKLSKNATNKRKTACGKVTSDTPDDSQPNQFLPLSSSAVFTPYPANTPNRNMRKRCQPVKPGTLKLLNQNTELTKYQINTDPDKNASNSWWSREELTSFGDLSRNSLNSERIPEESEESQADTHLQPTPLFSSMLTDNPAIRSSHDKPRTVNNFEKSCSYQARMCEQDISVDELSSYMEDFLVLPPKMSSMAEMMYT